MTAAASARAWAWWRAMPGRLALLGVPGMLGLALLVLAAWLWWGELPLERQAWQAQQDQVAHLRRQLQDGVGTTTAIASGPSAQARLDQAWALLWQALPAQATGSMRQADVLAAAQRQGVNVGSVQFRGERLKALPGVWRQRMVLSVDAPHPAFRRWLHDALAHPTVSLDALEVSRSDVMSDRVKAQVVMSLWWKLPVGAAETPLNAEGSSAAARQGRP